MQKRFMLMYVVIIQLLAGPHDLNYTTLNIQVTDVDDMDPVFDHDEYYLNITEEVRTFIH